MKSESYYRREAQKQLALVKRDPLLTVHLSNAVELLTPRAEGKLREKSEIAILQVIVSKYRGKARALDNLRKAKNHRAAIRSLQSIEKRADTLKGKAEVFAAYLDEESAGRGPIVELYATTMLERIGLDVAQEADRFTRIATELGKATKALKEATTRAKRAVPKAKEGSPPRYKQLIVARVGRHLLMEFNRLPDNRTHALEDMYNIFQEIYPLATGRQLPSRAIKGKKAEYGRKACEKALSEWFQRPENRNKN